MRPIIRLITLAFLILSVSCSRITLPDEGVSLELAKHRKSIISNVEYKLNFTIPLERSSNILGIIDVDFELAQRCDLVLDFRADSSALLGVSSKGIPIDYIFKNGHIIIPKKFTTIGKNLFSVEFVAGNNSLNRRDDFLYTLLVPDRASTVFPCFDQPDMKAVFNLTLNIPSQWTALSNSAIRNTENVSDSLKQIDFEPTLPISTYLFAFAVGDFQQITKTVDEKTFSMLHRETDREKLERNVDVIFSSHAQALDWLEEYTGIEYPFTKLDFILIPGFQYSGMEHAGAIFYRDSRLLLDENPTETQKLQQANLIAHEVAHQWFGNLVTMRWFNDVWLKEVFGGFMADLIVNPQYPDINHRLSFLLSHFPRAYSVDRTQGANPIVQDLDNLLFAGTIYGDIIYHKAPIMMQQLELLMGYDAFREGVREYLNKYSMGNADWDELVEILDKYSETDLREWARVWTQSPGRPIVECDIFFSEKDNQTVRLESVGDIPVPLMSIQVSPVDLTTDKSINITIDALPKFVEVSEDNFQVPLVYNSSGIGYGCFIPDRVSLKDFIDNPLIINNSVARASSLISLHEMFLEGYLQTNDYIKFLAQAIEGENEPQVQTFLLNSLQGVWWRFASHSQREILASSVEKVLWDLLKGTQTIEQKRATLSALTSIFISKQSIQQLYNGWEKGEIQGIKFTEAELTNLAFELMVRVPDEFEKIAERQRQRITNPDRVIRFDFVLPALSPDTTQGLALFEKLKKSENRRPEPTALEALRLLHHPLRSDFSLRLVEPSLDLLPEIQRTGDIFFPKSWLDAMFSGHSSPETKEIVNQWINKNPDLSPSLKAKLLQSADLLFRVKG